MLTQAHGSAATEQAPAAADRRPRLLFLARGFPPARTPSCTRTWNIAKYLTRFGWQVTVVTLDPSVWRRIDDPEDVTRELKSEGIKRILTDHRWRCLAYDEFKSWNEGPAWVAGATCRVIARRFGLDNGIGWIAAAEEACSTLSRGDVDLILATAPPPSAFRLAERLSSRLGCPYVMDYRDPWTQNPHKPAAMHPRRVEEEARLLTRSAAVTIVSDSWAEALDRQHRIGSKLHVISNGYDPEELAGVAPIGFDHFAIVYAGRFYPPKRVITPIMQALRLLKEKYSTLSGYCFHYYGPHQEHVRTEAVRCGVSDAVVLHGEVSQSVALSAVRGAHVAVVITSVSEKSTPDDQGIVTGKIFEPMSLNVPILLISPPASDAEEVLRKGGGGKAFRSGDTEGIAGFFSDLISGKTIPSGQPPEYSWAIIGRRLDRVLRQAVGNDGKSKSHVWPQI